MCVYQIVICYVICFACSYCCCYLFFMCLSNTHQWDLCVVTFAHVEDERLRSTGVEHATTTAARTLKDWKDERTILIFFFFPPYHFWVQAIHFQMIIQLKLKISYLKNVWQRTFEARILIFDHFFFFVKYYLMSSWRWNFKDTLYLDVQICDAAHEYVEYRISSLDLPDITSWEVCFSGLDEGGRQWHDRNCIMYKLRRNTFYPR